MTATSAPTRTTPAAAPAPTATRGVPAWPGPVAALSRRFFASRSRSTMWWGIGMFGMIAVQLAVYPSVADSAENMQQMVDAWPEPLRQMFDLSAYTTAAGFLNTELFSLMVPLILIAIAVSGAAAATAGEEERGTADLLLSTPVSRARVVVGATIALVASVAAVAALVFVTIVVGAPLVDLDIGVAAVAAGCVMTTLLALLFGAVALLIGASTGNRTLALGTAVALALAAFLLDALAPMADWLEPWQAASPFDWALGSNPLSTGLDVPMALLLGLCTAVLWGAALLAYRRHDLRSR